GSEPLAGDVIGFVLEDGSNTIYVTGDTVWYDGAAEVARRFKANVVLLFAGSAQTRGPFHLTMDTNDAIETAQAFPDAIIVPVHYEGWAHFKQSGDDLLKTFNTLGFDRACSCWSPGSPLRLSRGARQRKFLGSELVSALSYKRKFLHFRLMSALPPES